VKKYFINLAEIGWSGNGVEGFGEGKRNGEGCAVYIPALDGRRGKQSPNAQKPWVRDEANGVEHVRDTSGGTWRSVY
jgi:hypothetical protein